MLFLCFRFWISSKNHISNSVKGETQENNTMKKQCIRIDFRILINSISSIIAKDIT